MNYTMSELQNQKQNKWAEKKIYNQETIRWAFWIWTRCYFCIAFFFAIKAISIPESPFCPAWNRPAALYNHTHKISSISVFVITTVSTSVDVFKDYHFLFLWELPNVKKAFENLPANLIKEMSYNSILFSTFSLTSTLGLVIDLRSLVGGTSGCNVHWCWALFFAVCFLGQTHSKRNREKTFVL